LPQRHQGTKIKELFCFAQVIEPIQPTSPSSYGKVDLSFGVLVPLWLNSCDKIKNKTDAQNALITLQLLQSGFIHMQN